MILLRTGISSVGKPGKSKKIRKIKILIKGKLLPFECLLHSNQLIFFLGLCSVSTENAVNLDSFSLG